MTPLHSIQKDRGCTVGQGCEGATCTCKRMVRLVLEGMREPSDRMMAAGAEAPRCMEEDVGSGPALRVWENIIDTALKEVG